MTCAYSTAAFQKALDAAARGKGGTVFYKGGRLISSLRIFHDYFCE